jgi:23S rRNA G2445 N2-methylase RlmL
VEFFSDAVIGNPPYGAKFPDVVIEYLKNTYVAFIWRGESYLVFAEKAKTPAITER